MPKIIREKSYPKDRGTVPLSVVLRELDDGQFVTHLRDDSNKNAYFWGHYFTDRERAFMDYLERQEAMDAKYRLRGLIQ